VEVAFRNYSEDVGDRDLWETIQRIASVDVQELTIALFDVDNLSLLKEMKLGPGEFAQLGRKTYVATLAPPFETQAQYCIEELYPRSQAVMETVEGRRLFFRDEFDPKSGLHISGQFQREFPHKQTRVLSERVWRVSDSSVSVTLAKVDFANLVSSESPPFETMDLDGFRPTFELLREIIQQSLD
jgi:hypothetical protein